MVVRRLQRDADCEGWVQFIASKTKAALDGGLGVILCCGETLEVSNLPTTAKKPYLLTPYPATRSQPNNRSRNNPA